jgi:CBS domain-containing protein
MHAFNVEQWMNTKVVTITKEATVSAAAEVMTKSGIGALIVIEHEEPVAIVTERDIVRQVVAKHRNPDTTYVLEIMSINLITVEVGMNIMQVSEKMVKFRIKKMPVTENGKLRGIITNSDIVRTMAAFNKLYEVKDIIELGA